MDSRRTPVSAVIPNRPLASDQPSLEIDTRELGPGVFNFRLRVSDDTGNVSTNKEFAVITIERGKNPLAVLRAPSVVHEGTPFRLYGGESLGKNGQAVTQFEWTLSPYPPDPSQTVVTEVSSVVVGRDLSIPNQPKAFGDARLTAGNYEISLRVPDSTSGPGSIHSRKLRVLGLLGLTKAPIAHLRVLADGVDSEFATPNSKIVLDATRSSGIGAGTSFLWTWMPVGQPARGGGPWIQKETAEPEFNVGSDLPVGVHRFSLVITNAAGISSAPIDAVIVIRG